MGLHETKKLLPSKGNSHQMKRQPTEWEKTFARYLSVKGLTFRIYKELEKLNTKRAINPINKWANEFNTVFKSTDGQRIHEEESNILSHKISVNQEIIDIPSHPS
jgi:hypothetical protein